VKLTPRQEEIKQETLNRLNREKVKSKTGRYVLYLDQRASKYAMLDGTGFPPPIEVIFKHTNGEWKEQINYN